MVSVLPLKLTIRPDAPEWVLVLVGLAPVEAEPVVLVHVFLAPECGGFVPSDAFLVSAGWICTDLTVVVEPVTNRTLTRAPAVRSPTLPVTIFVTRVLLVNATVDVPADVFSWKLLAPRFCTVPLRGATCTRPVCAAAMPDVRVSPATSTTPAMPRALRW